MYPGDTMDQAEMQQQQGIPAVSDVGATPQGQDTSNETYKMMTMINMIRNMSKSGGGKHSQGNMNGLAALLKAKPAGKGSVQSP